jgi:RimJ/RimL family protein N-acetyltransferase
VVYVFVWNGRGGDARWRWPAADHRGQGYATEAARAAIEDGFKRVGLREIVALTALGNRPSIRVMERVGMTRTIEFDHPGLPEGSPLRRHILYRLSRVEGSQCCDRAGLHPG